MKVKVALNAIFSKIRKFDSSQINSVDLFFCIVTKILAKHQPSAGFPSASGGAAPLGHFRHPPICETAAFGDGKRKEKNKINWCAGGAINGFKNWTCVMRIPNMCLVLKLDNGNRITDRQRESQNHRAIQYRISI